MTRIFTDGAEFNDTLFFSSAGSIVTQGVSRSGTYSYQVNAATGFKSITGISEMYFRQGIYINYTDSGTSDHGVVKFRNGTTDHVSVFWYSAGDKFGINAGGSASVAYGSARGKQAWLLMEVYVNIANSPNGRVIVKIDGITDIDYTGDTQNGATTTVDNIAWYDFATGNFNFDDIALNDTNGLVDNSWCGDGHIETLMASGNGDTNDWTGSDGDSVNNYLLVDERAHDSDTTYVKATTAVEDMYNVSDYSPTNKIVTRIWAECRARDATVTSGAIKVGYKHSGTEYLSSSYITLTGSYARVIGDETTLDPTDSTVWSEADLDAIQFVALNSSSSSTSSSSSSSSSSTTSSSSSTEIP